MLFLGIAGGVVSIAMGLYINRELDQGQKPSSECLLVPKNTRNIDTLPPVAILLVLIVLLAIATEQGCGANFALVPHCNPCTPFSLSLYPLTSLTRAFWQTRTVRW
jgi:hypothetical protein